MKHLFVASSHLTFYICDKYIAEEGFSKQSCILFLTRDYHIPANFEREYPCIIETDYNQTGQKAGRIFAGANIMKTCKNIKRFDSLVDSYLKGEEFDLYAQVCSNDIFSLFVTKKNCIAYHIIEDGLASYMDYNPQTFCGAKYWMYRLILRPLFYRIFAYKNHFISTESPKYKGCIATCNKCFPLHQEKLRIIGLPFQSIDLGYVPDAILSIDPLFMQTSSKEVIKQIYSEIAAFVNVKGYKIVAYKFHPNFDTEMQKENKAFYRDIISPLFKSKLMEIDSRVALENVLFTYRCDFYTGNSSVAIYGKQMGAKIFSYAKILEEVGLKAEIPSIMADCFEFI